jgi:hypothetical protein
MKPNFALRLAYDSIELLQRSSDGWLSVGTARLDDPQMDAAIRQLRDHAARLAPEGVTSKLIIPETELRYETVPAPGPDDAARQRQIAAAVDGLTPYPLDDLIYDWVVEGDHARVVIAARETLAEAEAFAAEGGFNPVSFVAMPEPDQFLGEPFFGATRHAASILPSGSRVLPDAEPVLVVGRARIPAAKTMRGAGAPEPQSEAVASETTSLTEIGSGVDTPSDTPPISPEATDTAQPEPAPPAQTPPDASGAVPDPRERLASHTNGDDRTTKAAKAPARAGLFPAALRRSAAARNGGTTRRGFGDLLKSLRARLPVKARSPNAIAKPTVPAEAPPAKANTQLKSTDEPAFASRRKPALVSAQDDMGAATGPGGRLALLSRAGSGAAIGRARSAVAHLRESLRRKARTEARKPKPKAAGAGPAGLGAGTATAATAAAASKPAASFDRAPSRPVPTEPIVPQSRPPADEKAKAREAEALTIFGARSGSTVGGGDGARRGLVLTGAVFALLIALGLGIAFFAGGPETEVAAPIATETPEETAIAPEEPVAAPPATEDTAATEPAPPAPGDTDALATSDDAAPSLDADARLDAMVEEALRQEAPAEQFAEPEIGGTGTLAEDPASGSPAEEPSPLERLTLPGPLQLPDVDLPALISLPPPPPFGTEMELGDDGLIIATPEGAMTPGGVTVFARSPSEVPPARPNITPPAPQAEPGAEAGAEDVIDEDASAAEVIEPAAEDAAALIDPSAEPGVTIVTDPALAGVRPLDRPQTVTAAATANAPVATDADLGPEIELATAAATEPLAMDAGPAPGAIALATLRPSPRPEAILEQSTDDAEPAPEEAPEVDLSSATPQAVARSVQPNPRPDDFTTTVQRALAAAARRQTEPSQTAQAAPSQPVQIQTVTAQPHTQAPAAQPQAQTTRAEPQIPSSASVAETATERRAINLRRVNLIGIFGSQSNRRALVRMPNGQVVRVQVGDTLDGGRVSAIGDGELRYVRGGRNQVLRIGHSG